MFFDISFIPKKFEAAPVASTRKVIAHHSYRGVNGLGIRINFLGFPHSEKEIALAFEYFSNRVYNGVGFKATASNLIKKGLKGVINSLCQ